jgi:hypothetical protein
MSLWTGPASLAHCSRAAKSSAVPSCRRRAVTRSAACSRNAVSRAGVAGVHELQQLSNLPQTGLHWGGGSQ